MLRVIHFYLLVLCSFTKANLRRSHGVISSDMPHANTQPTFDRLQVTADRNDHIDTSESACSVTPSFCGACRCEDYCIQSHNKDWSEEREMARLLRMAISFLPARLEVTKHDRNSSTGSLPPPVRFNRAFRKSAVAKQEATAL